MLTSQICKRRFNSYIKSKKTNRTTIGPLASVDGTTTTENAEMASILNTFFGSVFSDEDTSNIPSATVGINPPNSELGNVTFKALDIKKKIDKLKLSSAAGPDRFSTRLLKETANEISMPLAIIFRKSLESNTVPEDWRIANVTPIFKKGVKSKPSNYRPVSLTSVVGKVIR